GPLDDEEAFEKQVTSSYS
nr:Chain B, DNA-binding protein rap1 [Schizosaccharomyces pombe 972h-]5YC2_D Chain D, DNA-binding protein rap1 [Schizosaccharomyces pombe 972h-]